MATTVTALTPAVGAIIENIDLRTLDESDFKTVAAAFDHFHGLLFRDQHLSDDDLVAFSARFGPLDHAPVMENGISPPRATIRRVMAGASAKPWRAQTSRRGSADSHPSLSNLANSRRFGAYSIRSAKLTCSSSSTSK